MQGQKVLLERTGSQLGEQELPDFQLQTPRRYPRENCLEEPFQAGLQDQFSPHQWEKSPLLLEPATKLAGTGKCSVPPLSLSSVFISIKAFMVLKSHRRDDFFLNVVCNSRSLYLKKFH